MDFSGEGENGFLIPDLSPGTHYQLIVMASGWLVMMQYVVNMQEICLKSVTGKMALVFQLVSEPKTIPCALKNII